jgi:hypothetical protein
VLDFGADPNGGKDSFGAFNTAIAQGTKSNQVWKKALSYCVIVYIYIFIFE